MTVLLIAILVIEFITLAVGAGFFIQAFRNKNDKATLAKFSGFLILIITIIAFTLHHLM